MNKEDITRMAREAGAIQISFNATTHQYEYSMYPNNLERFAQLVAAAEREACAKVCKDINAVYNKPDDAAERVATQWCIERIRARGLQ